MDNINRLIIERAIEKLEKAKELDNLEKIPTSIIVAVDDTANQIFKTADLTYYFEKKSFSEEEQN